VKKSVSFVWLSCLGYLGYREGAAVRIRFQDGFYKRQCQEKTLFPTRRGETVLVIEPLSPMMIVRFGQE
jgi:hypothetical protein